MADKVFVIGTFDQPVESLFEVDLMRYIDNVGIPLAGVVYKRSRPESNPVVPTTCEPFSDGRVCLHVGNFNAPNVVSCIRELSADLLIYAGGRDLLRRPLLESARLGCIGGHYGHLPEIRGMGTVEWSLLVGIAPTVAIQRISPGIDTGDILMQARVPLVPNDTFVTIRDRSYFLTKVMLALSAHALLKTPWQGTAQAIEAGRQYYRLHPLLQGKAEEALDLLFARQNRTQAG